MATGNDPARRTIGPIQRFLGEDAARPGPFALLGLSPRDVADASIIEALDRQLQRLATHIECDTPEADEVRLSLHAAAAQLLDPRVRALLISKWSGQDGPDPASAQPSAGAPTSAQARSPHVLLEHDAVLTLGQFGGWNEHSLHRLAALAHARGMDVQAMARTLRSLAAARAREAGPRRAARSPGPPQPAATTASEPKRVQVQEPVPALGGFKALPPDPSSRLLARTIIMTGAFLIGLVALAAIAVLMTRVPTAPTPKIAGQGSRADRPPAPPPSTDTTSTTTLPPEPVAPVQPSPDAQADFVRELAACTLGLQTDQEAAIADFSRITARLAAAWPDVKPDVLIAAQASIVEFVYRAAGNSGAAEGAVDALAAPVRALQAGGVPKADQISPAVFSSGVLARLARESDLRGSIRHRIENDLRTFPGLRQSLDDATFELGAAAAVRALPARLCAGEATTSTDEAARTWREWIRAASATHRDPKARERALLLALETVATTGPEPNQSAIAFRAVRTLSVSLDWRSSAEARRWLVAAFEDRRLTAGDLHAITSTIASSNVPGVDVTMVVPVMASQSVRGELALRFRRAWGLDSGVDRAEVVTRLVDAAKGPLARPDATISGLDALERAVVLSRLCQAADLIWNGRPDEANQLLDLGYDDIAAAKQVAIPQETPNTRQYTLNTGARTWVELYIGAKRSSIARIDLLDQLQRGGEVLPAEADLIVYDAARGSPVDVREKAQEVVRALSQDPDMVNAVLEALPSMPQTPASSSLVAFVAGAHLPKSGSPDWPAAARRALVERLLELTAAQGELGAIDRLAELLARSYAARAGLVGPAGLDPRRMPTADQSAEALWLRLQGQVDPSASTGGLELDLEEVRRRLSARLGLARGVVQVFAAYQVSAAEIVTLAAAGERSQRAQELAKVLNDMNSGRRRAPGVLHQVMEAEMGSLRAWLIRLGEEAAP